MPEEIRIPRLPREQIPRHGALAAQSARRWRSFLRGLFRPPAPPQVDIPDEAAAPAPPPTAQKDTPPQEGSSFPLDAVASLERDEEVAPQGQAERSAEESPAPQTQEEAWLFAPSAFNDSTATTTTLPADAPEPPPVAAQNDEAQDEKSVAEPSEQTADARASIQEAITQIHDIRNRLDDVPGDILLPTFPELEYLDGEWQRNTPLFEGDGRTLLGIIVDIDKARPAEREWIIAELRKSRVRDYRLLGEAYEVSLHPDHMPEQRLFDHPEQQTLWMLLLGMICDPETIAEHLAASGMSPQEIEVAMRWLTQTLHELYGPALEQRKKQR